LKVEALVLATSGSESKNAVTGACAFTARIFNSTDAYCSNARLRHHFE